MTYIQPNQQEGITRKEWLELRKKGISGTGASAVMGYNPYLTNVEYWELLTGRKQAEDISHKPCVQYGLAAEAPLIELFKLDFPKYQVTHKDYDLRVHQEKPFLLGSIDGELLEIATGRKGILEIKTTNILQSMQKEKWRDGLPMNYFYQVLHYLLVTGFEFVELKAQLKRVYKQDDGKDDVRLDTRHYSFERDEVNELLVELEAKETEFWERYIIPDIRPPLLLRL